MLCTFLLHSCLAGLLGQVPPANCPGPTAADTWERHQQAGWPQNVAWWAIPSDTGRYTVYCVGGGCPCPRLADAPLPSEGTWGWDYVGRWLRPNVILGWWHDRCSQGGTGAYQTDGPTLNHGEGTLRSLVDR
jgi:hypothetical protein